MYVSKYNFQKSGGLVEDFHRLALRWEEAKSPQHLDRTDGEHGAHADHQQDGQSQHAEI